MKKLNFRFLSMLLLSVAVVMSMGCKDDGDGGGDGGGGGGGNDAANTVYASVEIIGGSTLDFESSDITALYSNAAQQFAININDANGNGMQITIDGNQAGNRNLTLTSINKVVYTADGGLSFNSQSGSINVTSIDLNNGLISATFTMMGPNAAAETVDITNGRFTDLEFELL